MALWMLVAMQAAQPADAGRPSLTFTTVARCGGAASGDVVVCAGRRDRYRLPLPAVRAPVDVATKDRPGGTAALTPPGPCGIFAGERRCGKREAAAYGYGEGRDPITLAARVAGRLADPDD